MDVLDKIKELSNEYVESLEAVNHGSATETEHDDIMEILESIKFYTSRFLLFANDEIEGT